MDKDLQELEQALKILENGGSQKQIYQEFDDLRKSFSDIESIARFNPFNSEQSSSPSFSHLVHQTNTTQADLQNLQSQLVNLKNQSSEFEQKTEILLRREKELIQNLVRLGENQSHLSNENKILKKELFTCKRKLEETFSRLELEMTKNKESTSNREKASFLTREAFSKINAQKETAQAELTKLKEETQTKIKKARIEIQKLSEHITQRDSRLGQLQNELHHALSKLKETDSKLEKADNEKIAYKTQITLLQTQLDEQSKKSHIALSKEKEINQAARQEISRQELVIRKKTQEHFAAEQDREHLAEITTRCNRLESIITCHLQDIETLRKMNRSLTAMLGIQQNTTPSELTLSHSPIEPLPIALPKIPTA